MTDNDKEEAKYKESSSITANRLLDCNSVHFVFLFYPKFVYNWRKEVSASLFCGVLLFT